MKILAKNEFPGAVNEKILWKVAVLKTVPAFFGTIA
jgi:hypothetical protein